MGHCGKLKEWFELVVQIKELWILRLVLVKETFSLIELLDLLEGRVQVLSELEGVGRVLTDIVKVLELLNLVESLLVSFDTLEESFLFLI